MSRSVRVAVVGATGLVGQEILAVLAERQFPATAVHAIASAESVGERVSFGEQQLRVDALTDDALHGVDIAFFAAGEDVSAQYARAVAKDGTRVIDTSGSFADDPEVPLIVPEVNGDLLDHGPEAVVTVAVGALAALAAVLKPIDDAAGVRAVSLATYEPVSGIGQAGVSELGEQTLKLMNGVLPDPGAFPHQIGFNCIPAIGAIDPDGRSVAERKLVSGLRRVLARPTLRAFATAVRIPAFFGVGIAATVETDRPVVLADALAWLRIAPGLLLADGDGEPYVTLLDAVGTDVVHVGRVRVDAGCPTTLGLWLVMDGIRKGAAVNAVAIAERMLRTGA